MAIDITRAAFAGNVIKDEVILAHANFFAPTFTDSNNGLVQPLDYGSHHSVDACYTPRNVGTIEEPCQIRHFQGTHYNGSDFVYDLFLENPEANLDRGTFPLCYYYVPNPRNAGANGIKILRSNDMNYLISSGSLSGCSCAFLKSDDIDYFIHAGASMDSAFTVDPVNRRKQILRDLYNNAIDLSGKDTQRCVEPISSVDELVTKLSSIGFCGAIVTINLTNESVKKYRSANDMFSIVEYTCVPVYGVYCGWDMFVLINSEGKYSVGVREHIRLNSSTMRKFIITSASVL